MKTRLACWPDSQKHKNTIVEQKNTSIVILVSRVQKNKAFRLWANNKAVLYGKHSHAIYLIQTCQLLKRNRKHFPYLLLTSESSSALFGANSSVIWLIVAKYLGKLITQYLICRSHFNPKNVENCQFFIYTFHIFSA